MIAVALLLCGIFGNLTDRLIQGFLLEEFKTGSFWQRLSEGYVVDFLDFTLPVINYHWPAFNVADYCICIAAVLLFILWLYYTALVFLLGAVVAETWDLRSRQRATEPRASAPQPVP